MKKKSIYLLLGLFIAILSSVSFSSCNKDDDENEVENVGQQPTNQKPNIYVVYSRVEYVNKIYTLEITFGVTGVKEGQNVSVEMKYGTSYKNLNYSKKASRMNYSSDRYMCRLSNRKKGETIAFQGVLTIDGKEVSTASGTKRIN